MAVIKQRGGLVHDAISGAAVAGGRALLRRAPNFKCHGLGCGGFKVLGPWSSG